MILIEKAMKNFLNKFGNYVSSNVVVTQGTKTLAFLTDVDAYKNVEGSKKSAVMVVFYTQAGDILPGITANLKKGTTTYYNKVADSEGMSIIQDVIQGTYDLDFTTIPEGYIKPSIVEDIIVGDDAVVEIVTVDVDTG